MKVVLHYEDCDDANLHKALKITLPKSWKSGPSSRLLQQFVESYNPAFPDHALDPESLHLCIRQHDGQTEKSQLLPIAADAIVLDAIPDRADVYVCHGASQTLEQVAAAQQAEKQRRQAELQNTVACTHFGCKNRFPPGGPYPDCVYHQAPPVFHETAKFWSCCPHKKAYDWDDFQSIAGCCTGTCTDVKDDGTTTKQFLGGTDLRERAGEAVQLKSIDDFNKAAAAAAAGGSAAVPVLDRLRAVLHEMGVDHELFDQVVAGLRKEYGATIDDDDDAKVWEAVKENMGKHLKNALKSVAAQQQRIK